MSFRTSKITYCISNSNQIFTEKFKAYLVWGVITHLINLLVLMSFCFLIWPSFIHTQGTLNILLNGFSTFSYLRVAKLLCDIRCLLLRSQKDGKPTLSFLKSEGRAEDNKFCVSSTRPYEWTLGVYIIAWHYCKYIHIYIYINI